MQQLRAQHLRFRAGALLVRPPPPLNPEAQLTRTRDNGFLRYWTLPNLPLFLLALPMLAILLTSTRAAASHALPHLDARPARLLLSMAVAQGILTVLTLLNHHVQVITRMSSAYPVWYIWLAAALAPAGESAGDLFGRSGRRYGRVIVRYMVVYASVQAVLFLCFLPPA
ncbi:hypothetical protein IMZ48_47970 [Candidatus Bathyarchaeota archaeon]|nr:hypothetical protein [Candidatus Bathyarchaeota archaeon]